MTPNLNLLELRERQARVKVILGIHNLPLNIKEVEKQLEEQAKVKAKFTDAQESGTIAGQAKKEEK